MNYKEQVYIAVAIIISAAALMYSAYHAAVTHETRQSLAHARAEMRDVRRANDSLLLLLHEATYHNNALREIMETWQGQEEIE